MASLSKVCSMFRTGLIAPNVNLHNLNPAIKWEEFRMRVPTEITPLPSRHSSGRSLISMTSSGIGGTNAHIVLEAPPPRHMLEEYSYPNAPVLIVSGGLSPRSASSLAEFLSTLVADHSDDLRMLASIYGRRSRQMTWRMYGICVPGSSTVHFSVPRPILRTKPPIVFVFAGQGPQHFNSK